MSDEKRPRINSKAPKQAVVKILGGRFLRIGFVVTQTR
jgi:hypothetical protein